MAKELFMVSINILADDDKEDIFNVSMPEVPRVGDLLKINGEASDEDLNSMSIEDRQKYERRTVQVEKVTWNVTRRADKSSDHNFGFVEITCRHAE